MNTPDMRCYLRWVLTLCAAVFAASGAWAQEIHAVTVDTLNDVSDAGEGLTLAQLIGAPGPDGRISLREAISAANNTPGADTITFDAALTGVLYVGEIPQSLGPLPELTDGGTTIDGDNRITLNGGYLGAEEHGIVIRSVSNVIEGLAITWFPSAGVQILGATAAGNVVRGCRIGTDGATAMGNSNVGVFIGFGAKNNRIGGVTAEERNVISGNANAGVRLNGDGTTDNVVQGNCIGTNQTGDGAVPGTPLTEHTSHGVVIDYGASNNLIGGSMDGAGNVISGNDGTGVFILIAGTTGNRIEGNYIGTDRTGRAPLPNELSGVSIGYGANANIVGGGTGAGNIISGNGTTGVLIGYSGATQNRIENNYIGANVDGEATLGNGRHGVYIGFTAFGNVIGGAEPGQGNRIVDNALNGVRIDGAEAVGNTIRRNAIYENGGSGIVLSAGANGNIAAPVITAVGSVEGTTGAAAAMVDIYCDRADQGEILLDSVVTDEVGNFRSEVSLVEFAGWNVTATVTDQNGNTSAFSAAVVIQGGPDTPALFFRLRCVAGDGGSIVRIPWQALYRSGTVVNLRAVPRFDYRFAGWGGASVDQLFNVDGPRASILMDADKQISADFVVDETEGEEEGGALLRCILECANTEPVHSDGDGLSDCVEGCLHTEPNEVDTDGDGMPDNYEALYDLDPLNDDAEEDRDGDGLSNLDEFLGNRSNPALAENTYHVAPPPDGADSPGRGTREAPWATISYALTQVTPPENGRARIIVASGDYPEDVVLRPWVVVAGGLGSAVTIEGVVTGAERSILANLEVQAVSDDDVLLHIDGVAMLVYRVTFAGTNHGLGTGILTESVASGKSVIAQCAFYELAVGIEIRGAIPVVRRCIFADLSQAGIILRQIAQKLQKSALGDETDPKSGWNFFSRSIEGFAIINERAEAIPMQKNDWDTDDPEEVAARIEGAAVYEPYLAAGSALLAASVFCTLWDAQTQQPILNASVQLSPSSYALVTYNDNGVYSFPAVSNGVYTLAATAPSYENRSQVVNVAASAVASITLPLVAVTGPVEGEGEGETEGEGEGEGEGERLCGCLGGKEGLPDPGELLLTALALSLLFVWNGPRRRL